MNLCERIRNGECPFGLLKEGQTMSECPSGFPGCGCMDELMCEDELPYDSVKVFTLAAESTMTEIPCPECHGKCCRDSYHDDGTKPQAWATTALDLAALREQLRAYDKTVPRCKIENWRTITDLPNWSSRVSSFRQREICVLPEEHEGTCTFSRPAMGWPGFTAIQELIRLAEIATKKEVT